VHARTERERKREKGGRKKRRKMVDAFLRCAALE
jgi:hypothetical protein